MSETAPGARWPPCDPEAGALTLRADDGRLIVLPSDYLEHAHHGYALTGHVSQGATVERTYLLASPERGGAEWAYVAASRHRMDLRVYASLPTSPSGRPRPWPSAGGAARPSTWPPSAWRPPAPGPGGASRTAPTAGRARGGRGGPAGRAAGRARGAPGRAARRRAAGPERRAAPPGRRARAGPPRASPGAAGLGRGRARGHRAPASADPGPAATRAEDLEERAWAAASASGR